MADGSNRELFSLLRCLRVKLKQISDIDNSIFRMVQLKMYIAKFSCFDDADGENVTIQIQSAKAVVAGIINDVKTNHGDFAANWVTMHRMLKKREHALSEAQSNGILTTDDPIYDTLVQKQVQLTKLLSDSEIKLCRFGDGNIVACNPGDN